MPIQSKVVFCTIGLCSSLLATVTDDKFFRNKNIGGVHNRLDTSRKIDALVTFSIDIRYDHRLFFPLTNLFIT